MTAEQRQLVIAATGAEADAITRDLGPFTTGPSRYETRCTAGLIVAVCGIGLAEAAAVTTHLLATEPMTAVFSLGVAGGSGIPIGGVAIGATVHRADTGIEESDGRIVTTREAIGLGDSEHVLPADGIRRLSARLPEATLAHVLTVATVTGSAERATRVLARRSDNRPAVEDMEAWGVLTAALLYDVPFFAVKAVSNALGPRDRSTWDLPAALDTLSRSAAALFRDPPDWT